MLELAPDPTAMCTDTGDLRICTAKSALKKQHLQSTVTLRQTEKEIAYYIIDGSEIIYNRWI